MHKGKASYTACQGKPTPHSTLELLEPIPGKGDLCRAEPREGGLDQGRHAALAQGTPQPRVQGDPVKDLQCREAPVPASASVLASLAPLERSPLPITLLSLSLLASPFLTQSPAVSSSSLMVPPWSGCLRTGRELGCEGQPRASSDILHSGGVCLSPTSGLRDVIYADLIGVGLIGSSSSHMCWEGARESIKGSLHIMGIFLHLLSATPSPPLHFREPGHSGMRWEPFLGILTMGTLLKPDKTVTCA